MTFGKTNAVAIVAGGALGIAFFCIAFAFKDAFAAAAGLESQSISARALGMMLVPGVVAGLGVAALADRFVDTTGKMLLLPLCLFVIAAGGTAILLAHQFAHPEFGILVAPVLVTTGVTALVATVRGWMNA